jgi:hypothetical protein
MRPACRTVFRQDSLDAFILRFAGVKAFLFFVLVFVLVPAGQAIFEDEDENENKDDSFRAGLSTKTRSVNFSRNQIERSVLEKSPVRFAGFGRLVGFVRCARDHYRRKFFRRPIAKRLASFRRHEFDPMGFRAARPGCHLGLIAAEQLFLSSARRGLFKNE